MNFSCSNQEACPIILDSKCVIYEGENLLYIGVNTNDNYRVALEKINNTIANLVLTGAGITQLIGDVEATGPGIASATLATVNSTPGQFGSSTAIPKITVDGKGRITAISTDPVFIPSGSLSFIGDVTGNGNTGSDTTLTLATVNSNVYTTNNFLKFAVNAKGLITSATPVTSSDIITTLGYTPYNATNPAGYISTINGIVAGGELAGTYPNPTLVNAAVTAKVLTGVNITGGSIGPTDSILTAFGKIQNQINGLIGGSIYQGTWNAATNTPTLQSGVGTKGYYYIVNTPGSTNLDGITDWELGDWAIFDGTAWQQVDNTDAVVSVNGFTGAVNLTTDNIPEGLTNQYYTNTRARLALGITTTGSSGPATYDNVTGVFNIPDYSAALSGYVPVGRTLTINGTTYDLSANRSWTIASGPSGGLSGQILSKNSDNDYDYVWIDNYADWTSTVKEYVKAGEAITKGQAVYVSGADGTNIIVSKASNTAEATSSKTLGLLAQDLALNGKGYVITEGLLSGLNTSTANIGDPVWLGVNGDLIYGLVNKPYAPAHLVYIGVVVRVNANNGEIFIQPQNGFEMDELHNVSARNPANNAILAYNTSTSLWEKNTIAGVLGYTPANAATYVPYTGATSNVDLGTHNLTTTGDTFVGAVTAGGIFAETNTGAEGYIYLKGNGTFGVLSIYNSIFADGYKYGFDVQGGTTGAAKRAYLDFGSLTNSTTRTYTFPDASGTIALTSNLSSYVPYSGATSSVNLGSNILTASTLFTSATADGGLWMNQASSITGLEDSTTYTSIKAYTNRYMYFSFGQPAAFKRFRFDVNGLTDNTTITYTMPNATGTLALTSNLSSYLPLSGGTLTGALNGTSATFSSYLTAVAPSNIFYGMQIYGASGAARKIFVAGQQGYSDGFTVDYNGSNFVYGFYNGNVGIGTSSPSSLLHLLKGSGSGAEIFVSYGSISTYSEFVHNSNGGALNLRRESDGGINTLLRAYGDSYISALTGNIGFGTSTPTEGSQASGTISIIPRSSVSSGPLLQFAGNGRIRPASVGDRLSIEGNSLYLNAVFQNDIIASTILPHTNAGFNLGSASLRWGTVYTSDLDMSNGIGDYTIVEGKEDLFLYNNITNKVFKFALIEVDPSEATPKMKK